MISFDMIYIISPSKIIDMDSRFRWNDKPKNPLLSAQSVLSVFCLNNFSS